MPADQAAGLRRRSARRPVRCLHVFSQSPQVPMRVAQAAQRHGGTALVVDKTGRLFGDARTRSLFDWRQQLERGELHRLPLPCGDGWHAPGAQADEPAWVNVAQGQGLILFDEGAVASNLVLMPGSVTGVIVEVTAAHESRQHAYAVLKTLFHMDKTSGIALMGRSADRDRVRAACAQFLAPGFAGSLCCVAHEDDAFAELAVRMVDEETGLTTRE